MTNRNRYRAMIMTYDAQNSALRRESTIKRMTRRCTQLQFREKVFGLTQEEQDELRVLHQDLADAYS